MIGETRSGGALHQVTDGACSAGSSREPGHLAVRRDAADRHAANHGVDASSESGFSARLHKTRKSLAWLARQPEAAQRCARLNQAGAILRIRAGWAEVACKPFHRGFDGRGARDALLHQQRR